MQTYFQGDNIKKTILCALLMISNCAAMAADLAVQLQLAGEKGPTGEAGSVTISESRYGLVFTPNLKGLTPGLHGFHLHQNASCTPVEKDDSHSCRRRWRSF